MVIRMNEKFNRVFDPIKAGLYISVWNWIQHRNPSVFLCFSPAQWTDPWKSNWGKERTTINPANGVFSFNSKRNFPLSQFGQKFYFLCWIKTPPGVFSAQVDYIAGLTLLDPQYSWDRRSMPISFNYEKNAILFLLRRETFGLVF